VFSEKKVKNKTMESKQIFTSYIELLKYKEKELIF